MSERMILALDPSKTATGWIVYDNDKDRVVGNGCYCATMEKEKKKEFSRKTEINKIEQYGYVDFLTRLKIKFGIDKIVAELPHGSQSASASWSLSMVNSTISTFGLLVLGESVKTYLESDTKKANFGRSKNVSKQQIMDLMIPKYEPKGFKPHTYAGKVTKTKNEDMADALLVLTTYLNDNA